MRHLKGNLHRELDDAHNLTVFAPRRLIDELFYALFFDGVDVGFAGCEDMFDDAHRALLMAEADILADEALSAPLCEIGGRFVIYIEDGEIAADDRNARADFIGPGCGRVFGL